MKFVALVSGGKDSCFNILHCLANGHDLVCLANLYPPPTGEEEIDSFMYQTVGYDALRYYAKCIGKPLYSQMITGTAANKKLEYAKTDNDETEDLFKLLSLVIKKHPDVEAVSVGAILSNYQRTRVENVCNRLGLTSLSYLWQRDQAELMQEMCKSGLEAILIKVAAIGLKDKHLGLTLQQAYPILSDLNSKFGVNVCGEGGEFETLVLDAPFFKYGRLVIKEKKVVRHTSDEVWYLKLKVDVEEKVPPLPDPETWSQYIEQPPLLADPFLEFDKGSEEVHCAKSVTTIPKTCKSKACMWKANCKLVASNIYIDNLSSTAETVGQQIKDIFEQFSEFLALSHCTFANVQSVDLFVSNMDNFSEINGIYKSYFTKPLPPARCCVQSSLPEGIHALVSAKVIPDIAQKLGLHVQSRSYWAPSNIGPYSQTIMDYSEGTAYLSGQIPLIPKCMALCSYPQEKSAALALQHLSRVEEVTGYNETLLLTAYIKDASWLSTVVEIQKKYMGESKYARNFVISQIEELPKSAPVEWSGIGYKNNSMYDDDDTIKVKNIRDRIHVLFTDSLDEASLSAESHYTIFCKPDNLKQLVGLSYEFIPCINVYNSEMKKFKYAIVQN